MSHLDIVKQLIVMLEERGRISEQKEEKGNNLEWKGHLIPIFYIFFEYFTSYT